MEDRQQRINDIEIMLVQAEKDVKSLRKIVRKLKKIQNNIDNLTDYYENEYMDDYENYENYKNTPVLNQDSIWDVLNEHYLVNKDLVKYLIKKI